MPEQDNDEVYAVLSSVKIHIEVPSYSQVNVQYRYAVDSRVAHTFSICFKYSKNITGNLGEDVNEYIYNYLDVAAFELANERR